MKIKQKLMALVCAVSMLTASVGIVGCSSGCKSPTRSAYVSSGVTHVTVTAAMRGYNDYLGQEDTRLQQLATTNPEKAAKERAELGEKVAKVEEAYKKYQASQIAVLTAAQEFSKIPPKDPNAPAAQDRLNAAIAASSVTLNAVIDVLKEFGVQIQ